MIRHGNQRIDVIGKHYNVNPPRKAQCTPFFPFWRAGCQPTVDLLLNNKQVATTPALCSLDELTNLLKSPPYLQVISTNFQVVAFKVLIREFLF